MLSKLVRLKKKNRREKKGMKTIRIMTTLKMRKEKMIRGKKLGNN